MSLEQSKDLLAGFLLGQRLKGRTGDSEPAGEHEAPEEASENFLLGVAMGMASMGRPYRGTGSGNSPDNWPFAWREGLRGWDLLGGFPLRLSSDSVSRLRTALSENRILDYQADAGFLAYHYGVHSYQWWGSYYNMFMDTPTFRAEIELEEQRDVQIIFPALQSVPHSLSTGSQWYYYLYFTLYNADTGDLVGRYSYGDAQSVSLGGVSAYQRAAFRGTARAVPAGKYIVSISFCEMWPGYNRRYQNGYEDYGRPVRMSFNGPAYIYTR